MKKLFGLLLVLLLVMTTSLLGFAEDAQEVVEETDFTLEEQVLMLQEEIEALEDSLLNDELTEDEIDATMAALLVLESQLDKLLLVQYETSIEIMEATDTSNYSSEELIEHENELTSLIEQYEQLLAKVEALTIEDPQALLLEQIAALEEQLLDETLTEEEIDAINAEINLLKEEYDALLESIEEDAQGLIQSLEEEIKELEASLENEDLTEEEIAVIVEQIDLLKKELESLEEPLEDDHPMADRFDKAEELGITPGKMNLLEKLASYSEEETFDFDFWSEADVKDIMKTIKDNRKGLIVEEEVKIEEIKIIEPIKKLPVIEKVPSHNVEKSNPGKGKGRNK